MMSCTMHTYCYGGVETKSVQPHTVRKTTWNSSLIGSNVNDCLSHGQLIFHTHGLPPKLTLTQRCRAYEMISELAFLTCARPAATKWPSRPSHISMQATAARLESAVAIRTSNTGTALDRV